MSASSVKEGTHPLPAQATETLDLHHPFTPIDAAQLEHELSPHPDKPWTSQPIKNLTEGARVGFTGTRVARTAPNLASAHLHPEVINNELSKECSKGHIAGPYPTPPLPNLQCSGIGVVPKKNNTWRMIMHLSAPNMLSIKMMVSTKRTIPSTTVPLTMPPAWWLSLVETAFSQRLTSKAHSALFPLQPLIGNF